MPYITKVAIGELEILSVYGNDYSTKDGTGVRDYIHVVDLAKGHIKAMEKLEKEKSGLYIYNLGTGTGYSVLEIIENFQNSKLCCYFEKYSELEKCFPFFQKLLLFFKIVQDF